MEGGLKEVSKYRKCNNIITLLLVIFMASGCATRLTEEEMVENRAFSQFGETDDLTSMVEDATGLSNLLGTSKVLIVLDIDNTLLAMEQELGSDQWYHWQKELESEDPCNAQRVGNTLAVQGALYFASAMRPTQHNAPELVKQLQQSGLKVIVVTSRGSDFRLQTFRELRRNGYSFYASAIGPPGGYPDTFAVEGASRPALYEDGVYMVAGQDKGKMLKALLEKTGTPDPVVIVMADDKKGNLRSVMKAFQGGDTWVHAWYYTGEIRNAGEFDPDMATDQWLQIRSALETIEEVMGTDNFDLTQHAVIEGCNESGD
jgi:hypothetical protein